MRKSEIVILFRSYSQVHPPSSVILRRGGEAMTSRVERGKRGGHDNEQETSRRQSERQSYATDEARGRRDETSLVTCSLRDVTRIVHLQDDRVKQGMERGENKK